MTSDPGLEALLAALRAAGIHVGVTETLRLRQILALEPEIDPDLERLRLLVAAVMVKSNEERARFEPIFREWAIGAQAALDRRTGRSGGSRAAAPEPAPAPRAKPSVTTRRRWWLAALAVLAALSIPVAFSRVAKWMSGQGTLTEIGDGGADAALDADAGDAGEVADADSSTDGAFDPDGWAVGEAPPDTRTYDALVPELATPPLLDPLLVLSLVAFVGAAGTWLALRNRRYLPAPMPAPTRSGPTEIALTVPARRGFELLDATAEEALVGGMFRAATEDEGRALDVDRTIDATARASGFPTLRFQKHLRHRTVWLWVDASSRDPAIGRLAREIAAALDRAGLSVEQATYWAVPERLTRADGTLFKPADVEDAPGAIVALLTDGRALAVRQDGADRRARIARALRALARFPRRAFVDFAGGHGLASVAGAHGIPVVAPEDAVSFLTGGRPAARRERASLRLTGDARAWAAACALAPGPIDDDAAFAVRRALGLDVSPWVVRALRGDGARIDWPFATRVDLCGWLRLAERGDDSLLARALAFWRARYDAVEKARAARDAVEPWTGTPAARTLLLERALLDLWDRPDEAARVLYTLLGTDLEPIVKRRAAVLGPLEAEGTREAVVLPWYLRDRPDEVRVMLAEIGFGAASADAPRAERLVSRPGRLWIGVGLAVGMGLAALGRWGRQPNDSCHLVEEPNWCVASEPQNGEVVVAAGRDTIWRAWTVSARRRVVIGFDVQRMPCEERLSSGLVLQRCGSAALHLPDATASRRWITVLEGAPTDPRDKALADRLLDARFVDMVIRARAPLDLDALEAALGRKSWDGENDRLVVLHAPGRAPPAELAARLKGVFEIARADRLADAGVLRGHSASVDSCAWSPNGTRVLTTSKDGTARVWNADDLGSPPIVLEGHEKFALPAAWSPDGKRIVTAFYDKDARIWDAADGKPIVTLQGHTKLVNTVRFSPDGTRVLTTSWDNTARIWDARDGKLLATLQGHTNWVVAAFFSPDGKRVLTMSNDYTARLWDAKDGKPLAAPQYRWGESVAAIAFSPDGTPVIFDSDLNAMRLRNAQDGKPLATLQGRAGHLEAASFSPDGTQVVTANLMDDAARLWSAKDGKLLATLEGGTSYVKAVRFSPNGTRVVTASADGTARVWNADGTGAPIILRGHTGTVTMAAWSPDGQSIVTASDDKTARIWPLAPKMAADWNARDGACLSAAQRVAYLAEMPDDAERTASACTPLPRSP